MKKTENSETKTEALSVLEVAQNELTALLDERANANAGYLEAAKTMDGVKMLELKRRADDLPALISVAQMRVINARITSYESKLPQMEVEHEAAARDASEAEAHCLEATRALNAARSLVGNMSAELSSTRSDIAALKRERENLVLAQRAALAPVVRSLPHAVA